MDTAFLAPRTPVEEALAQIWADVIGLDQVGIDDDFMELGGDSLRASQVVSRVLGVWGSISLCVLLFRRQRWPIWRWPSLRATPHRKATRRWHQCLQSWRPCPQSRSGSRRPTKRVRGRRWGVNVGICGRV
ncbi:MAG: hypothetical protein IH862_01345 [Chloroflexi bacterium]|nr:hypothetical protein [Chloroflexota bacterium]